MILRDLLDGLINLFYEIMYSIFSAICILIDFLKDVFYKLCGIDTVSIQGKQTDLLSSLMQSDIIKKVFLSVFIIGFILLFVFTIIAIIKSYYSEKQNWKTVLTKTFQSFVITLLIPFTVGVGIVLVNTIMKSVNIAMNPDATSVTSSIGGQFLTTIGANAYIGPKGMQEEIASKFVSGELFYGDLSVVKRYYDINNMNYIIGHLGGIVMLVMFALSALTFVQRIFDVILLYVISPVSISTLPLDEGNRFKLWKDMLIAKILSAYGIILVMNLFFLIIPQVYHIDFFGNSFHNGIVYILFLIGGSFAVTKASRVIAQLCGGQQTGGELAQMIYNIRSGIALTRATTALIGGTIGGLLGGSDYKKNRHKGQGMVESMSNSFKSNRTQKPMGQPNKGKKYGAMPLRIATLPIGVLRDLATGGIVRVGKNFGPRVRNAFTGSTLTSKAEVKPKSRKSAEASGSNYESSNTSTNTSSENSKPMENTSERNEKDETLQEESEPRKRNDSILDDVPPPVETVDETPKTSKPKDTKEEDK